MKRRDFLKYSGATLSALAAGALEAALVDPPHGFVLRTAPSGRLTSRMCFTLAYELRQVPGGTRLVTRMRARIDIPGGRLFERFVLLPGDVVVLPTDGIQEAQNSDRKMFGVDRMLSFVRAHREEAASIIDGLRGAIAEFSGHRALSDDTTAIIVRAL